MSKVGIVLFPGSNCERDVAKAMGDLGAEPVIVWHGDTDLPDVDIVVLPGGFAHGDYLRTGALARFSPIMDAVADHAQRGGLLIGICNGFQVLCEAGLLPGALRKNSGLRFLCKWVDLKVERNDSPFSRAADPGQILRIPINHFEGNWYCEPDEFENLVANGQILLRYVDNPNGSFESVAGITNATGNVFGLMPHPERACELLLGSADGAVIFRSMLDHVADKVGA